MMKREPLRGAIKKLMLIDFAPLGLNLMVGGL